MLVHDFHRAYDSKKSLWLPDYCRAPLGLAGGSALFASFHKRYPQKLDEVILTPYADDVWSDLWRIEMHLRDGPGQLELLTRIFDANGITILYEASRDAFETGFHIKTFMVDCQKYASDIDGQHQDRKGHLLDRLVGLERMILLQFIDVVRISEDGRPRLLITRNLAHYNLHEALIAGRLTVPIRCTIGKGGRVDVGGIIADNGFEPGEFYSVLTANIKSHIVYCSLARDAWAHRMCHIVIWFDGGQRILATILERLRWHKINIARSLLRDGAVGNAEALRLMKRPFTLNAFVILDRNLQGDLAKELVDDRVLGKMHENGTFMVSTRAPHPPNGNGTGRGETQ